MSKVMSASEIATAAAKEAIKMYKEEQKKQQKKTVLRNTRVLLNHYNDLKNHYEHAKCQTSDIIDIKMEDGRVSITSSKNEEIVIESIKRSRMVTLIMLKHIDASLALLRMKSTDQPEKYEVINDLYIHPIDTDWQERIFKVSEKLHISESTVRRWEKDMINELGVYLFGADGLRVF